jgi:uncharacterized Ntn-hydrolase superfamily protein
MTWSIIARTRAPDGKTEFGVAIASRFLAVGALCVYTRRGVGAVATQALLNPLYGPAGLDLLEAGFAPADVVAMLAAGDAGRDQRQIHVLGVEGRGAASTGAACVEWCGDSVHDDFSVAGNMLAGPEVLAETVRAYEAHADRPFAERLLAAMQAGEAAGGDKRGKQAAALRLHADEDYASLDLRVDDHEEPLVELQRLYEKSFERAQPFLACLPGRQDPAGIFDRHEIESRIEHWLQQHPRNIP